MPDDARDISLDQIKTIGDNFASEILSVNTLPELANLKSKYIGKDSGITSIMKLLSTIPIDERKRVGGELNRVRAEIESVVREKEAVLRTSAAGKKISSNYVDITLPGDYMKPGSRHPLSIILREIAGIFTNMGFDIEEGPEVETDYYNFEALNFPIDHPTRDMQDTFYVEDGGVLRTHTSPVQIRVMEKKKPPFRFISLGKVYRCDADITHSPIFHQIEGLMVDTDVTFANLKAVLSEFLRRIFPKDSPVRFRPSFFPFTEPSAEVDIGCIFCKGAGCNVCKQSGWLEILGAGMVDPRVFRQVGYSSSRYSGFAFGLGIERIAMLKFGIDDIRLFYESDLRFLKQF